MRPHHRLAAVLALTFAIIMQVRGREKDGVS